jgi:hypothetical protein
MGVQQRPGQQHRRQQHMLAAAVALRQLHTLLMKSPQQAAGWMLRHTSQQSGMICHSCWVLTQLVMHPGGPHPLLQPLCSAQQAAAVRLRSSHWQQLCLRHQPQPQQQAPQQQCKRLVCRLLTCRQQHLHLLQQQLLQVTPCQPMLQRSCMQQQLRWMQGRLEVLCCRLWFAEMVLMHSFSCFIGQ